MNQPYYVFSVMHGAKCCTFKQYLKLDLINKDNN